MPDEVLDIGDDETILPDELTPGQIVDLTKDSPLANPPKDFSPKRKLTVNRLNNQERMKYNKWEYEREHGTGDHFFAVHMVWAFLPKHCFESDPQYEKYIKKLDICEIQFVKRYVMDGSNNKSASMKTVLPDAPGKLPADYATKFWKRSEVRQLYEYLLKLKDTYAEGIESQLTAEEIIQKFETLFRKSDDPGEVIRLGEMVVKYRNIDLMGSHDTASEEIDREDFEFMMRCQGDSADNHEPGVGGGVPGDAGTGAQDDEGEGPEPLPEA